MADFHNIAAHASGLHHKKEMKSENRDAKVKLIQRNIKESEKETQYKSDIRNGTFRGYYKFITIGWIMASQGLHSQSLKPKMEK